MYWLTKLILTHSLLFAWSSLSVAANWKPLFPVPKGKPALPLVKKALHDPSWTGEGANKNQLETRIAQLEPKLAKKKTRKSASKKLCRLSLRLAYIDSSAHASAISNCMKAARYSSSKGMRDRFLYSVYVYKYLSGESIGRSKLSRISPSLDRSTKTRALLLAAIQSPSAVPALEKNLSQLNGESAIVARLVVAKTKAIRKKPIQALLRPLANRSEALADSEKREVFLYSIYVWRLQRSKTAIPFLLTPYRSYSEYKSLVEWKALRDLDTKKYDRAIAKYRILKTVSGDDKNSFRIDKRILEIQRAKYFKTRRINPYHKALKNIVDNYEGKPERKFFLSRYETFATKINRDALKPRATKTKRTNAIKINQALLKRSAETKKNALLEKIANLHVLNSNHNQAVEIYSKLYEDTKKRTYLAKAIRSQHSVARWPLKPAFGPTPKTRIESREKLLGLYEKLLENKPQFAWTQHAQKGLLLIHLGKSKDAFDYWMAVMEKNSPKTLDGQKSLGLMLTRLNRAQDWDRLEKASRKTLKARLKATDKNKPVNVLVLFQDALFKGGKFSLNKKDYATSIRRLKEFSDRYISDKRRPEALWILAKAYRKDKNSREAIAVLKKINEEYANTPWQRKALYRGGLWARSSADEEMTIYFLQRFVRKYQNDPSIRRMEDLLIELYQGRKLYGYIARIHLSRSTNKNLSTRQRLESTVSYLEIEERYGDKENAMWAAEKILANSNATKNMRAVALAYQAKTVGKKALPKLKALEKELASLGSSSKVNETRALVLFKIADIESNEISQEVFSLELKDPTATLNKHYQVARKVKARYDAVCKVGLTSYCAPAMFKFSRTIGKSINAIQDITINKTLDKKTVDAFQDRKIKVTNYLARQQRLADEKSLDVTNETGTLPLWTQQIIWYNTNDWNFDGESTSGGHGYVQWTTQKKGKKSE